MITKNQLSPNCEIISVLNESLEDIDTLSQDYDIDAEMLMYARDYDERSRIEFSPGGDWNLIVYDIATLKDKDSSNVKDPTAPITFIFKADKLLIFMTSVTKFDPQKLIKIPEDMDLDQLNPMDTILLIIYSLAYRYYDVIHAIDKRRQMVQKGLNQTTSRKSITQLMGLQTQLVYYLTALDSDNRVLNELEYNKFVKLNQVQSEQLKDVQIEISQGLEMAQMASAVIKHVSDAYSNILDNSLNNTMKFLTIWSIILAVPTIIFGFFGQNVQLPMVSSKMGWLVTIGVAVFFTLLLWGFYELYQHLSNR
ncbi:magnesium transporter CorA family protein [Lentilactobacillus laojiaonis]|uniref:magnesium transporter CorA family protein n=1 Tax=Lentilactobacillus laojiaonis TaxID=2883998 RepID=UPI001D0A5EE4|nr:magnesium transporter CorA family protein [Lentilactobacillus laojiaonis]UDM32331.1 magnesium transporter CorA family protein [Lentilactobacillus laojiaonis]